VGSQDNSPHAPRPDDTIRDESQFDSWSAPGESCISYIVSDQKALTGGSWPGGKRSVSRFAPFSSLPSIVMRRAAFHQRGQSADAAPSPPTPLPRGERGDIVREECRRSRASAPNGAVRRVRRWSGCASGRWSRSCVTSCSSAGIRRASCCGPRCSLPTARPPHSNHGHDAIVEPYVVLERQPIDEDDTSAHCSRFPDIKRRSMQQSVSLRHCRGNRRTDIRRRIDPQLG